MARKGIECLPVIGEEAPSARNQRKRERKEKRNRIFLFSILTKYKFKTGKREREYNIYGVHRDGMEICNFNTSQNIKSTEILSIILRSNTGSSITISRYVQLGTIKN